MHHARPSTLLPALLLALATATAQALPDQAEARYQQERAACLDGSSPQGRTTCLKEAGAARNEARRHRLDNGETADQLRANALMRCQRVATDDRAPCERMARGGGTRSGAVAEGAIVKQITTLDSATLPAPAASR
jgi:hypothetical protein